MPLFTTPEGALWLVNILLTVGLALRLWQLGLYRSYPFFAIFLIFAVLRSAMLFALAPGSKAYGVGWAYSEWALWLLYTLVTMEVYSLVLIKFPGIQTVGRWVLVGALVMGLCFALITLQPELRTRMNARMDMYLLLMMERGVLTGLSVVVLIMSGFLLWFPVSLPRNVVVHSLLFAIYFLSKGFALLLRSLAGHAYLKITSVALLCLGAACLISWITLLRRQDDDLDVKVGHRWNREREEDLIGQLQGINDSLGKLVRH